MYYVFLRAYRNLWTTYFSLILRPIYPDYIKLLKVDVATYDTKNDEM